MTDNYFLRFYCQYFICSCPTCLSYSIAITRSSLHIRSFIISTIFLYRMYSNPFIDNIRCIDVWQSNVINFSIVNCFILILFGLFDGCFILLFNCFASILSICYHYSSNNLTFSLVYFN